MCFPLGIASTIMDFEYLGKTGHGIGAGAYVSVYNWGAGYPKINCILNYR